MAFMAAGVLSISFLLTVLTTIALNTFMYAGLRGLCLFTYAIRYDRHRWNLYDSQVTFASVKNTAFPSFVNQSDHWVNVVFCQFGIFSHYWGVNRMSFFARTQFVLELGMNVGTIGSDGPGFQNRNSFVVYQTKSTSIDVNFVQL